jgi:PAS domain S-box-containing protein
VSHCEQNSVPTVVAEVLRVILDQVNSVHRTSERLIALQLAAIANLIALRGDDPLPTPKMRGFDRPALRLALAAIAVIFVFLLRQMLVLRYGFDLPEFITLFPTIMAVSLFLGLWSGLLATALGALLTDIWVFAPIGNLLLDRVSDILALAIFIVTGILMSLAAERYRRNLCTIAAFKQAETLRAHKEKIAELEEGNRLALEATNLEIRLAETKRAEARFRRFYETNLFAILYWNIDGRIVDANQKFLDFTGYSREDLTAGRLSWVEMTPPEYSALDEDARRQIRETGVHLPYEKEYIRKDGTRIWGLFSAVAYEDDHTQGVTFILDVTHRKRAEDRLHKLNRTLRALSNSRQALLRASDEATYLKEVCSIITNDCGYAMVWIGLALEDAEKNVKPVAHSGFDMGYLETLNVTWEDNERGRGPTGISIRTGQRSMCIDMQTDPAFLPWREEALKRGYASSIAIPIIGAVRAVGAITIYSQEPAGFAEGEIELLEELVGDVESGMQKFRARTDRDRALEALRESEERLELFVEHAPAALAMFDNKMRYLHVSRRWITDYGLTDRAIIGLSYYDVFPDMPERWKEAHRRGLAGEVVSEEADRFERTGGTEQWIHWELRPWKDAKGQVGGILIFSEEITENKLAEEERQISIDFLKLVNQSQGTADLIQRSTAFFQTRSGCEAVGIRLRNADDYPYFETLGFSKEFVQFESKLCTQTPSEKPLQDSTGDTALECLCGNVIRGRYEISKPFYTAHGSFWTNSTTELNANAVPGDLPSSIRNRCNQAGYESVALFPIYVGDERFGLLQFNDRRKGRFTPQIIALWEKLAGYLATAVSKFRAEEALQESESRFRNLFNSMDEGFCIVEIIFDSQSKPLDYRFLQTNQAFERQTGLHEAEGKLMRELAQNHEDYWFDIFGQVALTGKPVHFQNEAKALNSYYSVHAYRVGEPEMRQVAIVFDDISDARRAAEISHAEELHRLLLERTLLAQEEERRRIARELHDEAGQLLTALLIGLRTLENARDMEDVKVQGQRLRKVTAQTIDQVGLLARGLHPTVLEDLGIGAALSRYAAEYTKTYNIAVELKLHEIDSSNLPSTIKITLYRILQEALTNVAKHSGADVVTIEFAPSPTAVKVDVIDNGCGFDAEAVVASSTRLGIHSMRERAVMLGGTVSFSSPSKGSQISVHIPLGESENQSTAAQR